jgi:excisionase family DNA binding protein
MTGEALLTVDELAARWNKSKWWIYEHRSRIALKSIKFGNHYRFRIADIEAWEEANAI